MKVLITGAGGFLGHHLCEKLSRQGHEITSFSRHHYPKLEKLVAQQVVGDLSDSNAVERAAKGQEVCFHVASKVAMWGRWEDFYQTNVVGTQNLLRACETNGLHSFIYTSTPSVVFGRDSIENGDETLSYPTNAVGLYGRSKALAEQEVLGFQSQTLKTVSLRPHLIFGPRDENIIPGLLKAADAGKLKIIGDGENLVDITYVGNVVDAHLCALKALNERPEVVSGQAYFIGQGPLKLWSFINDVLVHKKREPVTRKVSFSFAYRLGHLMELCYKMVRRYHQDPPMTRFVALQLSKHHYFSHQKAQEELGWTPQVSIEEAIKQL